MHAYQILIGLVAAPLLTALIVAWVLISEATKQGDRRGK